MTGHVALQFEELPIDVPGDAHGKTAQNVSYTATGGNGVIYCARENKFDVWGYLRYVCNDSSDSDIRDDWATVNLLQLRLGKTGRCNGTGEVIQM